MNDPCVIDMRSSSTCLGSTKYSDLPKVMRKYRAHGEAKRIDTSEKCMMSILVTGPDVFGTINYSLGYTREILQDFGGRNRALGIGSITQHTRRRQ
jgi:hypothetical protein